MIALVVRLVEFSRRHAALVVGLTLLAVALIGATTLRHLSIDTDTRKLFAPTLPWRRAELQSDLAFPQNVGLLVIVIDGATPDQAQDAAATLARRLSAMPELFRDVRQPTGDEFFRKNGLLFLPRAQTQQIADQLIAAQPILGTLASDPSARGVLDAIDLMAQGPLRAGTDVTQLAAPFRAVATAIESAIAGDYRPLSWQTLLISSSSAPSLQIVLARPSLDFGAVQPGRRAIETVHAVAQEENLVPSRGVRVRVTGPVALADDQLAALGEGAGTAAAISLVLLVFWLALAVRSARAVAAILTTLAAGLVLCAAVAVRFVGPFNPISIAFAPLFVGIAIDFGIQLCVRYAAERELSATTADALRRTAVGIGLPLVIAGAATAVGFLSLAPTDYRGVSDLGVIAGSGMLIALLLNLTLLPALLQLLRVGGFKEAAGIAYAAPLDGWLIRRRAPIGVAVIVTTVLCLAAVTRLHFDFDPIDMQNPKSESVQAFFDLMKDPQTSPYTLDVLAPSASAAGDLARRFEALPQVSQVLWLASLVPQDQSAKLEIIEDARELLAPTLSPVSIKAAPSAAQVLDAAVHSATDIAKLGARGEHPAAELADALTRAAKHGVAIVPLLSSNLAQGISERLQDMRRALQAAPVTLESIPAELRRDWLGIDGRYRIQIFMQGSERDPNALRAFVAAVRSVAPDASGTPVGIQESGRTVVRAFAVAGCLATAAITLLLALVLRNPRDVAAVLGPLLLAGLLTLAHCALAGIPLNFANIVTLPLLLSIGVAFDIYFVLRWRAGEQGLLGSPTARAIVFSALTTGTAFGSLALSKAPAMADMGALLGIGLLYTLICTLLVLPALLGNSPAARQPTEGA